MTNERLEDVEGVEPGHDPAELRESGQLQLPGACAGGRTMHLMQPEWRGRGFEYYRCRWCDKREPA